jgi:hypothetical protein
MITVHRVTPPALSTTTPNVAAVDGAGIGASGVRTLRPTARRRPKHAAKSAVSAKFYDMPAN